MIKVLPIPHRHYSSKQKKILENEMVEKTYNGGWKSQAGMGDLHVDLSLVHKSKWITLKLHPKKIKLILYVQYTGKKILKNGEPGLGLPLVSRTKPPEPPGCLIMEDLQALHIPTKQETRGLDTIQATSFFPWWLLLFIQENFETKGDL